MAYLDVSDRLVNYIADPSIREVALGGPDTTVRQKTVWQVKLLPLEQRSVPPEEAESLVEQLSYRERHKGRLRARVEEGAAVYDNRLYRVQIHDAASQWVRVRRGENRCRFIVQEWVVGDSAWAVGQFVELAVAPDREPLGSWRIAAVDPSTNGLTLTPDASDELEISAAWLRRTTTYKWSRENGSIAYPVEPAAGDSVDRLRIKSRDAEPVTLQAGDWVEFGDERSELTAGPMPVLHVIDYDRDTRTVFLDPAPPDPAGAVSPFLQQWDVNRDAPSGSGDPGFPVRPVVPGAWNPLENGISIYFVSDDHLRRGDFWTIPVRTHLPYILWPFDAHGPVARPPDGIAHRHCPLALLRTGPGIQVVEADYRRRFLPLTNITQDEGDFVRRSGDSMRGDLAIEAHLRVTGHEPDGEALAVIGRESGENGKLIVHGPAMVQDLRGSGIVDNENIRRYTITQDRLAFPIGPVPDGSFVMFGSPGHVPGFRYTGASFTVYDPASEWKQLDQPAPELAGEAAVTFEGRIYTFFANGDVVVLEDGARPRHAARMEPPRRTFAVALDADRRSIYVVGGEEGRAASGRVERYDIETDSWARGLPALSTPRRHLAAFVRARRLFTFGGETKTFFGWRTSGSVEELDLESSEFGWRARSGMPTPRSHFPIAASPEDGPLYAIGGRRKFPFGLFLNETCGCNEVYHLHDEWEVRSGMPTRRAEFGAAALGDRIFALGGARPLWWGLLPSARLRCTEEYDPQTDSWRRLPSMRLPRWSFGALMIENVIYAFGGRTSRGQASPLATAVLSRFFIFERERSVSPDQDVEE